MATCWECGSERKRVFACETCGAPEDEPMNGGLAWAKDVAKEFGLLGRGRDVMTLKAIRRAYSVGYQDGHDAVGEKI